MTSDRLFAWQQQAIISHSQRLLHSFQHWTGRSLSEVNGSAVEIAQALFEAPFVLVLTVLNQTQFLIMVIAGRWNCGNFPGKILLRCLRVNVLNQ